MDTEGELEFTRIMGVLEHERDFVVSPIVLEQFVERKECGFARATRDEDSVWW